ncbi:MAG TPA: hypothetical protein VLV54_10715 [Thermoanaerobaculia bacterium]|nr:hypothetical protein [Thermoanaerobaculia bacterium]
MAYDRDQLLDEGRRLIGEGISTEDMLQFFRSNGATLSDSIRLVKLAKGVDLAEAKRIVHFSDTWKDFREDSEKLHDLAERVAREFEE